MRKKENAEIRAQIVLSGYTITEVAAKIGVSREWLSRLLSKPLTVENKVRILNALAALDTENGA